MQKIKKINAEVAADMLSCQTIILEDEEDAIASVDPDNGNGLSWYPIASTFIATRLQPVRLVIIDEIFMLTAFDFERVVHLLNFYIRNEFRLILVGDPHQCLPFYDKRDRHLGVNELYIYENKTFLEMFPLNTDVFIELYEIKRTSHPDYIRLLTKMRATDYKISIEDARDWEAMTMQLRYPNTLTNPPINPVDGSYVVRAIAPHKKAKFNEDKRTTPSVRGWQEHILPQIKLHREEMQYIARDFPSRAKLKVPRGLLYEVNVYVDQPVIFLDEEYEKPRLKHGVVLKFDSETVTVRDCNYMNVIVHRYTNERNFGTYTSPDFGSRMQMPIWDDSVSTVHKLQGCTLNGIAHVAFVERCWSKQLVYTSLS